MTPEPLDLGDVPAQFRMVGGRTPLFSKAGRLHWLSWIVRAGSWEAPRIEYLLESQEVLQRGGHPLWTGKWTLGNGEGIGYGRWEEWSFDDVYGALYDVAFRDHLVQAPPFGELRSWLLQSRRAMLKAHLMSLAQEYRGEFAMEDMLDVWRDQTVREVMES